MKNAIFIITIISLSLSILFAINIQLGELTKNQLSDNKFFLATSSFCTIVGWILLMLKNDLKENYEKD